MPAQTMTTNLEPNILAVDFSGISRARLWTGRALSGLAALFFIMDGGMKLFKPRFVVEATVQLGYPESVIIPIGMILLTCTLLYLIPRTAVLGAVLVTGYLGGAVASNLLARQPVFNLVFPIIFGCIVWAGLYLRDRRVQQLLSAIQ